jgi:hypothetical protein
MLARNHDIAQRIDARGFPLAAFESLQSWQRKRIGRSYADLVQLEGFGPAVHFFLTELYGGLDFRERDQDIGKVMPVMIRFLPDRALQTMAEAFELQAISLEFDMAMAAAMVQRGTRGLDMAEYCEIYRSANDRGGRERQITLIRKLGYDLDQVVRWPLVNYLVRLLRGPAHAGFGPWTTRACSSKPSTSASGRGWRAYLPGPTNPMAFEKSHEGAAEVIPEVADDFTFDLGLEEHQHHAEPGLDANFAVADRNGPVDTGALKVNVVAVPTVVDVEFAREIVGQLVRSRLGLLAAEVVSGVHIDVGHGRNLLNFARFSVRSRAFSYQTQGISAA